MSRLSIFRNAFVLIFAFLVGIEGFGQDEIYNLEGGDSFPADWTDVNNVTAQDIDRTSYYLLDAGNPSDLIISPVLDLSGYSSATLKTDIASFGTGANQALKIEISYDGGSSFLETSLTPNAISSSPYNTSTINLASVSNQVQIKYSNSGTSGKGIRMQDIILEATPIVYSNTVVQFASVTYTEDEDATTVDLCVDIINEDAAFTEVDVVMTSGSGLYLTSFTETLTFPANSNATQCATITWPDNGTCDGNETYTFELQNATGGDTAAVGAQNTTELTLEDDESFSGVLEHQGFEGIGWGYTLSIPECTYYTSSTWQKVSSLGGITPSSGSYFFGMQDVEGACNGFEDQFETITFNELNTSDLSGFTVSFDYRAVGYDTNEDIKYELFIDGVGQGEVLVVDGYSNYSTPGWVTETIHYTGSSSTAFLIISIRQDGATDYAGIDNVQLSASGCFDCVEPTTQASNITFADTPMTSVDVDWTDGTPGSKYILVAREGSAVNFTPVDGVDYAGDVGGGNVTTAIDQGSGNRVVYAGYGSPATVSGLTYGSDYYFQVFTHCVYGSFDYLTTSATGNDGTQEYTVPDYIEDSSCGGSNELESTFEYTGGGIIGDVDLFVSIAHPYRPDVRVELVSPEGTVVQVLDGFTPGSAANLEVIFDDESAATLNTADHIIDGIEDQTIQCDNPTDLLSDFDGENPNGIWILRVCDDYFGDIGSLRDWYLDIEELAIVPEPTNHPTSFGCFAVGSDEIDLLWNDAIGTQIPDGYLIMWSDVSLASITAPIDGAFIPDGANAANIPYGDEVFATTGLTQNTEYFFKIFPYTNSGAYVDYKTVGVVQSSDCTTDEGPCGFETFDTAENSGSYGTISWTGNNGVEWEATDARSDQDLGSDEAILLRAGSLTNTTPVSGGCGEISFNYARIYSDNSTLKVFVNGIQYGGDISVTSTSTSVFSTTINIGGPISIELRNSGHRTVIANLTWDCYVGCIPAHSIVNFTPSTGPIGTTVSINGTGFIGATDVDFNGVEAAAFSVLNDTVIQAVFPSNGLAGPIEVTVDGCTRQTITGFVFITDNNQCGSGGGSGIFSTDLFISEVYDATSGALSYVEVFNGTGASVNLTSGNYVIEVNTGSVALFPMSGTLPNGETYILRLGDGTSSCSGFTIDDDHPFGHFGFNGNDEISLIKNGVLLDFAPNPNATSAGGSGSTSAGFSQSRNSTITSPNTTYTDTEWTISNTENCDDIGYPPFDPAGENITINTHPADVDCDAVTFSVDAETTLSPTFLPSTYTWRYAAPGDADWSLVSSLNGTDGLVVTGANTTTITITGNSSILLDYQFYADMGTGGTGECRKFSNTANYSFETKSYYRTVSSGDWSDLSIWEMADSEVGPYTSPVCQYPIDRTSDKIVIIDGHDIELDVEIKVDWLEIESNSTLVLTPTNKLTIYDGNPSGSDLIVHGTLVDNGTSGNGVDLFNDLPTWEMASNATLIKTNTSSVTVYRDNYEGGIANIPIDANWIYRRVAGNNITVASVNMVYPNLSFENDFGTTLYTPVLSTHVFSGNSTSVLIKGDLNIGIAGTGRVTMRNNNTHVNPLMINGGLYIGAGSGFTNQASSDIGTGLEIQGDVLSQGTFRFDYGSGPGVGVLKLSGDQDIYADSDNTLYANHFIIDKDPGYNVAANLSFDIKESAQFLNGILELNNDGNIFYFDVAATASDASNFSFVDGKVQKTANTLTDFTYPIGDRNSDGNFYQPARIFGLVGSSSIFEAQYFIEAHPLAGAYYDGDSNSPSDNHEIGNCDYWTLNKISGSGNVQLGLRYTNIDEDGYCNDVDDSSLLRIASLTPANVWDPDTDTADLDDDGEIEFAVTINSATGGTYGDFALSSSGGDQINALPIELISFEAKPLETTVNTNWITSTEINNDYFTVERSADTHTFMPIGTMEGAGTSHGIKHYSLIDEKPLTGISYYRLKQTDFDGLYSYSDVKSVSFFGNKGFELELLYRNENELYLAYKATSPYIFVEVYDLIGQRLFADIAENYGGRSILPINLSRGVYVVRISSGSNSDTGKVFW